MKQLLSLCAALLFAAGLSAPAAAVDGLTIYTSRAAFMAAIHGAATDNFDDLSTDDNPEVLIRSAGDYSYRIWSTQTDTLYRAGDAGNGSLSDFGNVGEIVLSDFTGGMNAVGGDFFNTDAFGQGVTHVSISVTAYTPDRNPQPGDDLITSHTFDLYSDTGFQFLGFTWTQTGSGVPAFSFRDADNDGVTWPTLDNLVIGIANPVPEPASWALMLGGFGLVGGALRRRAGAVVAL
jgi:hypothetical protein